MKITRIWLQKLENLGFFSVVDLNNLFIRDSANGYSRMFYTFL
jgi:hypothetical protein